ncbi:2-oxoacid:acceptor oxidoreductase subunit alpha [Novipirellula artificiosorum]|uniref:2-oxoglutarate oxidoreductase subunit KorA n=1 Tax=Novipirellula artificiosorum TaxID=2528016 RepID=A0A5C6D408_9BACT|nr:2-oxoacid:acceptor oxidoreductase subunit alpha [Novipirellula artificiosorum]TWU31953.1 2-oxoglutarate oxidoreductase subunit KorA [Novipirellula artificiosorum]
MREITIKELPEHIVEIVSDAGEGAQKAAVSFAQVCAKAGNGLWTVEIIPSEIQPPPHTTGSASGNRIRLSRKNRVTNVGNKANVVLAFNEMALLSRIEASSLADDVVVIIDSMWASHPNHRYQESYKEVTDRVRSTGGTVLEVPMEEETLKVVEDARRGKNMFAVGLLTFLYSKDPQLMQQVIRNTFAKKSEAVINTAVGLAEKGYDYAKTHFEFQYSIEATPSDQPKVAMNGNTALALGAIAAGFELCSMYPITPATSASHALADFFESFGGFVHQAEDEIAAIGVAVGASYTGKTALTITSGPGMALKTEFQGLAVMTETPLVIVNVQRGGPSTGLPTKIEQGDLLHSLFGAPGDAPKVIIAPSSIEECYYILSTARKIADEFRMLVIVLSDANLATGQQVFPRPDVDRTPVPPILDLSPVPDQTLPYDWDETTGLSKRLIPGQPGGMGITTSLNHDRNGKACYDAERNQRAHTMRSRKLATLQKTLQPPPLYGAEEGDLLLVGWGSTRGAIEEAVDMARAEGYAVASTNIQFLSPLPPGLKELFSRYRKVMTVELNYSDDPKDPLINEDSRRYGQLCFVLRARTLLDIDCYARVPGQPFMPIEIYDAIVAEFNNRPTAVPTSEASAKNHSPEAFRP